MQSTDTHPNQQLRFGFLPSMAIKIIIATVAAAALVYALSYFSATHLVMLGLLSGMVLTFIYRIDTIKSIEVNNQEYSTFTDCSDGGTFNHKYQIQTKDTANSVVHDGGSHERSSSLRKKH